MKTIPSMSGLLPAQFKADLASAGIGWNTINPPKENCPNDIDLSNEISKVDLADRHGCIGTETSKIKAILNDDWHAQYEIEESTENNKAQSPTSTEIKKGDVVYILPDYRNQCGDTLKPNGVYVVHDADDRVLKLREEEEGSFIADKFVKKISDFSKVTVSGEIAGIKGTCIGHISNRDIDKCPILIGEVGCSMWCKEDTIFVNEDLQ